VYDDHCQAVVRNATLAIEARARNMTSKEKMVSEEASEFMQAMRQQLVKAGDPKMTKMPLHKLAGMSDIKVKLYKGVINPMRARARARRMGIELPSVSGYVLPPILTKFLTFVVWYFTDLPAMENRQ
jgi:hypothetical protein